MKKVWMIQVVLLLVFVLVACGEKYTVTFVGENGEVLDTHEYSEEEEITPPDFLEKTGYHFEGWYTSSDEKWDTRELLLDGDMTLYAKWSKNTYMIEYVDYDETVLERVSYEYGEHLEGLEEVVSPSRIGYTFTGWDIVLPDTMPDSDLRLKATYQIKEFVLSFVDKGGQVLQEARYEYGADLSNVLYPDEPSRARYVFTGWDTSLPETMPSNDLIVTATYVFDEIYAKVDPRVMYLDNQVVDGRGDYYSNIFTLIPRIEGHALYPSLPYENGLGHMLDYYRDGVSKEEYILEDERTLLYASYSSSIANLIREVPYVIEGFKEGEAFSYVDTWITTYANEDYLYYYSENEQEDYVFFEVQVEEENILMNYLYKSDTELLYQRNDFAQGFLKVRMRNHGNEEYSYTYEYYDYQTDQYTMFEYKTYKHTVLVVLGDYLKGEVLTYRKDVDATKVEVKFLLDGYSDIIVEKTYGTEETYNISYNVMNVSGWDYFSANQLFLNDEEVLSVHNPKVSNVFEGIRVEQSLETLGEDNFQIIGNATYQGTITLLDIQNALTNAQSISSNYTVFYTEDNEVDFVRFDSLELSLEDLKDFFEDKIGN